MERLHKFLARCGLASRRNCEQLILDGRVAVNGKTVTQLGHKINPENSTVTCDGIRIKPPKPCYFIFFKPKGIITTCHDEKNRLCVSSFFNHIEQRVFPVGRLDKESDGLLIVTNDGELCNKLTHPASNIPKTYIARIQCRIDKNDLDKIRNGVWLAEGKTGKMTIVPIGGKAGSEFKITLLEGKNREIRRAFAKFGYKVKSLRRIKIGELSLQEENLLPGRYKRVSKEYILHKLFGRSNMLENR